MENRILDIFYNHVIPEAANGKIDCYMYYNIAFNTLIREKSLYYECNINNKYLLLPTLEINDKSLFDELLTEYVTLALEFYDDTNFYPEVLDGSYYTEENKVGKEKVILALLWTNATIEDFKDPCTFLRRRIEYFKLQEEKTSLEYSHILDGRINIEISKERISQETPYSIKSEIINDNERYEFPVVRFGIYDDTVYLYTIQKSNKDNNSKKFNRSFYKINENLVDNNDLDSLKDITPSFVIAAYLAMKMLEKNGYTKFKIVNFLPIRWNSKRVVLQNKIAKLKDKSVAYKKLNEEIEYIQSNLTEKFLRTFRRIAYHDTSYRITAYPFEVESSMSLIVNKNNGVINNSLFNELNKMINEQNIKKMG